MSRLSTALTIAVFALPALPGTLRAADGPGWLRKPTVEDLARVYPREAVRKRIWGRAVMHCKVTVTGTLSDCAILEEAPEDMGFGAAVLRLAPKFQMSATTPDGKSVEGARVDIPIRFQFR
jgi:TonB family protein